MSEEFDYSTISNSRHFPPDKCDKTPTEIYIDHVKSLDPLDDVEPLKEFGLHWILKKYARWPIEADSRVLRYMHRNRMYKRDPNKYDDLMDELTKETSIQGPRRALQPIPYRTLEERVVNRVAHLASLLQKHNMIAHDKFGILKMSMAFKDIWTNSSTYWEKATDSGALPWTARRKSIYDPPSSDEEENSALRTKLVKKDSTISSAKPLTPTTNQRRRREESVESTGTLENEDTEFPHPKKKQKVAATKNFISKSPTKATKSHPQVASPNASHNQHMIRPLEDPRSPSPEQPNLHLSQLACRSRNPSPETLSTPPLSPIASLPKTAISFTRRQPEAVMARPSTPPTPSTGSLFITHTESSRGSTPLQIQIETIPKANSPVQMPTPTKTPSGIFFTLQDSLKRYDLNNPVPASQLKASSLSTFFAFFSERSCVPLDQLDCLTFSFFWACNNVEVIRKEALEAEWEKLKDKMRRMYRLTKLKRPGHTDFEVWVDIGNTKEAGEEGEDEDLGGL
jgi:hypothetical protein